jgi:hypothetical protein
MILDYHDIITDEWDRAIEKACNQAKHDLDFSRLNRKQKNKFPRGYIKRMNKFVEKQ